MAKSDYSSFKWKSTRLDGRLISCSTKHCIEITKIYMCQKLLK